MWSLLSPSVIVENDLRVYDTLVHVKGLDDLFELYERCVIVFTLAASSRRIELLCTQFSAEFSVGLLGKLRYLAQCRVIDHRQRQGLICRVWCRPADVQQ